MLYPDFNDLLSYRKRKPSLAYAPSRAVQSAIPGNHLSPFRGQGLEFDSVREYVFGDDIRNIDWRVTARTGSPHLKLFKGEHEHQRILCIDMNADMRFGTRNTFKSVQAARVAALLGWQGIAQHDRVGACLFGDVPERIQLFSSKRTHKSFCTMLKMVTEPFLGSYNVSIHEALQRISKISHTGALIYLISDFMNLDKNPQDNLILSKLKKKCDVVFIAINDPADRSIYPVGTIGLCNQHAEKVYVNTDSISGRNAYTLLWQENRRQLYEITSKLKIPLIELTTESNVHRDLTLGLKTIAKRKKQ